ncbi:Uncharacterised protein [Serratia quinivorans]|uniref:hypothetical protein n=1 Tax=Serratia quinivorans TaxID=137545 RepID=UPI0021772CC1|nr:hypothetical protein [Serratia quinivorans]CAI1823081.1 Uncharacterised protein [Serratia quinivorans]
MATIELSGGSEMEKKLKEMMDRLGEGTLLRVGFLENATYPSGEYVATIAASNEFGDPGNNQPPRPFFRNMIADNSSAWPLEVGKVVKAVDFDGKKTLQLMGERIKDQLQGSIRELVEPPLSPYTIKKKGFDKPLIDTGHMLNSVDYDVREEE